MTPVRSQSAANSVPMQLTEPAHKRPHDELRPLPARMDNEHRTPRELLYDFRRRCCSECSTFQIVTLTRTEQNIVTTGLQFCKKAHFSGRNKNEEKTDGLPETYLQQVPDD